MLKIALGAISGALFGYLMVSWFTWDITWVGQMADADFMTRYATFVGVMFPAVVGGLFANVN